MSSRTVVCLLVFAVAAAQGANVTTSTASHGIAASCGFSLGSAFRLPTARRGGDCGAGLARCQTSQCCSQYGRCENVCSSTCQCEFSGRRSYCPGSTLLTNLGVPVAPSGGICGQGVATCPAGECCSVLSYCTTNCAATPCSVAESGSGSACRAPRSKIRRYDLTVRWAMKAPDGYRRQVITINGMMPGPTLRCNVGDRLLIRFNNRLPEPTTMHWHGILQRGTVTMDGVPGVTQVAIPPFSSQIYDFVCSLPGAYWYHSHFKTQYIDGMKGALMVEDPAQPVFPATSEAQLSDWYHVPAARLLNYYLTPASEGDEPVPISALINANGQGNCTAGSRHCKYTVLPAAPGTCTNPKTKIRFINTAGFAEFIATIDGHRMIVISLDSIPITPSAPLRAIQINAGQRVVVLVCPDASHPPGAPAWVRAHMQQNVFPDPAPNPTVLGILQYGRYSEHPRSLPTTQPISHLPGEIFGGSQAGHVDPYALQPLSPTPPPPATQQVQLDIDFYADPYPNSTNWAHFNGIAMDVPPASGPRVPSIVEALLANRALPPNQNFGYNTIFLQEGGVVDLVINNYDTGEHPMHLHGHQFWVMARGRPNDGPYNATIPLKQTPLLRDTATVNLKSYIVLRFVAANPGTWMFHCHIDWHLAAGLAVVFAYGA